MNSVTLRVLSNPLAALNLRSFVDKLRGVIYPISETLKLEELLDLEGEALAPTMGFIKFYLLQVVTDTEMGLLTEATEGR